MKLASTLLIIISLYIQNIFSHYHTTQEDIREELAQKIVFYGSVLRLQNVGSNHYLHSHDVSYGSGSRQQSVTALKSDADYNSYWNIKNPHDGPLKTYKDEVKCGDVVRFEHVLTKKNLHSHNEKSPLSNNQEVSCYGLDGDGDDADDWVIECVTQDVGDILKGNSQFNIQHKLTKKLLYASKQTMFNKSNCGQQCPIMNQLEISAVAQRSTNTEWKIQGGLLFEKKEQYEFGNSSSEDYSDEEDCEKSLIDGDGYEQVHIIRDDL